MKGKKFVVIGPTYPYKGGISHFNTLLCKELMKNNKVKVISWKKQYPNFLYPGEQFDTVSKEKLEVEADFILHYANPFSWIKVFTVIKKEKPNKVIYHWVTPFQAPIYFSINLLNKLFTKTKILYICHNVLPHEKRFFDKILFRIGFLNVDEAITHSDQEYNKLKKLKSRIKIVKGAHPVYDMFSNQKFDPKKIREELNLRKNVLLFFGYVRPYKGLYEFIKNIPSFLKKKNFDLLIVGEFWEPREKYDILVKNLGIEDHVKIVDRYIPNEEVGKYFAVADAVVCPYVEKTGSGVTELARGFGKKVIENTKQDNYRLVKFKQKEVKLREYIYFLC